METKSTMELCYEEYLQSDDREIIIDDKCFYKIIYKGKLSFYGGTVLITVPWELFSGSTSRTVMDENMNEFELGAPVHFSFRTGGGIPEWYFRTATLAVKGIQDKDAIGDFVALIEMTEGDVKSV